MRVTYISINIGLIYNCCKLLRFGIVMGNLQVTDEFPTIFPCNLGKPSFAFFGIMLW